MALDDGAADPDDEEHVTVPEEALADVDASLRVEAEMRAAGLELCFGTHPATGRPAAVLRGAGDIVRVLPMSVVSDPEALAQVVRGLNALPRDGSIVQPAASPPPQT